MKWERLDLMGIKFLQLPCDIVSLWRFCDAPRSASEKRCAIELHEDIR